jgi:hypothetical protein
MRVSLAAHTRKRRPQGPLRKALKEAQAAAREARGIRDQVVLLLTEVAFQIQTAEGQIDPYRSRP